MGALQEDSSPTAAFSLVGIYFKNRLWKGMSALARAIAQTNTVMSGQNATVAIRKIVPMSSNSF